MNRKNTYRAILCNSAGELDFISAANLETLARSLGRRLIRGSWTLAEDDTIRITRGDAEQVT